MSALPKPELISTKSSLNRVNRAPAWLLVAGLIFGGSGCMNAYKRSVGAESTKLVSKIFLTDYNTAWQSVLDALKSNRLDVTNREGGFVQTKWTENTADKNFTDSFGGADAYLKAQFRFKITAAKGFYNGKPSVRVTVQKDQTIQRDVLEGWRPVESDTIEENTVMYRISRIIWMKTKTSRLEEDKLQRESEDTNFGGGGSAPPADTTAPEQGSDSGL